MYCWFTNIELTASYIVTQAWTELIQITYFLSVAPHSLAAVRNSRDAPQLGVILNRELTSRKLGNAETVALHRPQ